MTRSILAAVAVVTALLFFSPAHASYGGPVDIKFENPERKFVKWRWGWYPSKVSTLQFVSGWPLTIQLTVRNELGITIPSGLEPFFPNRGKTGYIVFDDPDGCLSMTFPTLDACKDSNGDAFPPDETVLEFTPDVDDLGNADNDGNPARIVALMEATSGQQSIQANPADGPQLVGPLTSVNVPVLDNNGNLLREEEVIDGYGRAADDDIPGLVLVSPHGHGVVYNPDGSKKTVYELANLAGMVNSVGYALNNRRDRTTVTVNMVVPRFMFTPVVVADDCVGNIGDPTNPDLTQCRSWYRVNGEDFTPAFDLLGFEPATIFSEGFGALVEQTNVKISAMVVSGIAPDTVQDLAAPYGKIDEYDLQAMGYKVIGHKRSIKVDMLPSHPCFGLAGSNILHADIDSNGIDRFGDVCPASPGSLSRPPR